jgi:hypothetical protein
MTELQYTILKKSLLKQQYTLLQQWCNGCHTWQYAIWPQPKSCEILNFRMTAAEILNLHMAVAENK